MRTITTFIIVFFSASTAIAMTPQWMHKTPKEGNPTYSFVPITIEASNIVNGRNQSLKMLSLDRGLLSSLKIQYKSEDTTTGFSKVTNGQFSEDLDIKTVEVTTFEGEPILLQAQIVDEYLDTKKAQFTTLYRVGIVDNPSFDQIERTTSYVSDPATWGLALIPGAAQFHKGSYLKGSLILSGMAALVGGIIFTENQRTDYVKKIAQTHDAETKRAHATKSDHFATGRNICIGAAAALYVYNLVDAIVSPGARRIIVYPSSTSDGHFSIGATYNF